MSRTTYLTERLQLSLLEQRPARWDSAKAKGYISTGTESIYEVIDTNFPNRNKWNFFVRVPARRDDYIQVRPRDVPNRATWGRIDRISINFARATKGKHRGLCYADISLANPFRGQTRFVVKMDERNDLPRWFESLLRDCRAKATVRPTKTGGDTVVLLVSSSDHRKMIELFFASKVWVLEERFTLRSRSV